MTTTVELPARPQWCGEDQVKPEEAWKAQLEAFGAFIRSQRQLAKLSLRELAELATVSNPYLSQIERGLHEPSIRVVRAIAKALDISTDTLLAQIGLISDEARAGGRIASATEAAIAGDSYLTDGQREALLAVYRSYVAESRRAEQSVAEEKKPAEGQS
jgi:transcriptional regulator with XRE-family HTH domain